MNKLVIHGSEYLYGFILSFYPKNYRQEFGKEMKYVFLRSLKDAYTENGEQGLVMMWVRTLIDAGKSLITQHVENQKGGIFMKTSNADIIRQNKVFLWLALATGLLLSIPLIAMQFTHDVNWTLFDFIVAGALLFGTGSLFVLVARTTGSTERRVVIGIVFLVALLWLWIELAVGLFTNWGS